MTEVANDGPGTLRIVVRLDDATFVAVTPADTIPDVLDALEGRIGYTAADRASRMRHMRLRLAVVDALRAPTASRTFGDLWAAACLWLAVRHYEGAEAMGRGVRREIEARGTTTLSVSVGEAPGAQPGTAWSFMVGPGEYDGRPALSRQVAGIFALYEEPSDGTPGPDWGAILGPR